MNEKDLLDAMSGIDPRLLRRSEENRSAGVWKKVLPLLGVEGIEIDLSALAEE